MAADRVNSNRTESTVIPYSELKNMKVIAQGGFGVIHRANHAVWGSIVYKQLGVLIISDEDRLWSARHTN